MTDDWKKCGEIMNYSENGNLQTATDRLTVRQVATMMGVCERTVVNWRKAGLPCIKIGRKVWILARDLQSFMEAHRTEQGA